jgi:hypothetical protein
MSNKDDTTEDAGKSWVPRIGSILKYAFLGEIHGRDIKEYYQQGKKIKVDSEESKKIKEERMNLKRELLKNAIAVTPILTHEENVKNKGKKDGEKSI